MDIRIPQSNVPSSVAYKAITKEMHDGLGRATTTASSLEVEQGSGMKEKASWDLGTGSYGVLGEVNGTVQVDAGVRDGAVGEKGFWREIWLL
nr:hypothetical protein [Tanacetum cinerariifolium]